MTKDTALSLLRQYGKMLRKETTLGATPDDTTLVEIDLRWPEDGSEKKAMRWLGFIQGALYAHRVFTLTELKEHSRTGKVETDSP